MTTSPDVRYARSGDVAIAYQVVRHGPVTMQGPWRELTRELGWTAERYAKNMTKLLLDSLLACQARGRPAAGQQAARHAAADRKRERER